MPSIDHDLVDLDALGHHWFSWTIAVNHKYSIVSRL